MADYRNEWWDTSYRLLGTFMAVTSAITLGRLSNQAGPRDSMFTLSITLTVATVFVGIFLTFAPDIRRRLLAARAIRSQETA